MAATAKPDWHSANQRYLMAALAAVREALERHAGQGRPADAEPREAADSSLRAAARGLPAPAALDTLSELFDLSPFERDLLLLCAGVELDAGFAALCAAAQGEADRTHPSFSLALAALPDPHWSAMSPAAPLRHWRLLEVGDGIALTTSPLRIDERILNYLTGVSHLDERLVGLVTPLHETGDLVSSHQELAERIAGIWSGGSGDATRPAFEICGDDLASKRAIAAGACTRLGLELALMPAHVVPSAPTEIERLIRLWDREAALSGRVLLLDCDETDANDRSRERIVDQVIQQIRSPLMVTSRQRRRLPQHPLLSLEVKKPTSKEQRAVWNGALGMSPGAMDGEVERLASQFNLSAPSIRSACAGAQADPALVEADQRPQALAAALWESCRRQARPRLGDLAERIEPAATWNDLILPERQREILEDIAAHVRHRARVHEDWGFACKGARGLGIAALFAGTSGTGKTMAAELLADELRLDLYRIDLSQVVNKYIGETEKNLARVFDAAEEGGAILLFDEADALFGKRSEVKDSHDRYANIEVSYLLQRMEAYRGLAILTTNLKDALDGAFLRRLRFVVQFPFPDAAERAEIWQRIFPDQTPTKDLDPQKLARLNVAGGNIRNIALHAAFLAARDGGAVTMGRVLRAARSEYAKLEKPLSSEEIREWV